MHVARITSSWEPLALEPALPPALTSLRGPRAIIAASAPQAWIRVPALAMVPFWRAGGEHAGEIAIVVEGDGNAEVQLAAPQGSSARSNAESHVGAWIEVYAIKKIDRKLE